MKIDKTKSIFLLGGRDLEMEKIKELLLQEGYQEGENLFDRKLDWGAKLSAYRDILDADADNDVTIYGIELLEDVAPPANYHAIDHHNDKSDRPASLLQVLRLLEREPSREEHLIAANDTGHIAMMRCIGASDEEIDRIRAKERRIHGITQYDEKQAREEIAQGVYEHGIFVVRSSLSSAVAISDFCDKRPLLVLGSRGMMFYAQKGLIERVSKAFASEIEAGDAFHGQGYFGFDQAYLASLTPQQRSVLQQRIIQTKEEYNMPMSYHAFMFPFRFDKKGEDLKFEDRIAIDKELENELEEKGWYYEPFKIKNDKLYNEYSYFTEPVRKVLYNQSPTFEEGENSYFFQKKVTEGATYTIDIGKRSYTLQLTDISLRLFETGIGILTFEIENHAYSDFEDMLKINDYGRRVYPQFVSGEQCTTGATKGAFLADRITLKNGETVITEDFSDPYDIKVPDRIIIGKHVMQTLGEGLFGQSDDNAHYTISPALDDRMFVVSYAEDPDLVACLQREEDAYLTNDSWYRYLFVDGNSKTVQHLPMQKALSKKATYPRWLGWGTLWGVTRYSLVALSTQSGRDLILTHAQYHYHQMAILILANHASLARFGDEVSDIAKKIRSKQDDTDEIAEQIASLYRYYIRYINTLYFREVTFQDQGIELFDIAKKHLGFDKEAAQLDNEIAELHNYVEMVQEKERNRVLDKISLLGAIFLPPTVIAGIFGMNTVDYAQNSASMLIGSTLIILSALFGYLAIGLKSKSKWVFGVLLIVTITAALFLMPQKPTVDKNHAAVPKSISSKTKEKK